MSVYQVRNAKGTVARIVSKAPAVYRVTATHRGPKGSDGVSAYQAWLGQGNTGTLNDFLNSLRGTTGESGKSAYQLWLDAGNSGSFLDFLDTLQGPPGDEGQPGYGVPEGGAPGQLLGKVSYGTADTAWIDPPATGGGEIDPWIYQRGVSLSGMEFAETQLPGIPGTDYTIHRNEDFAYYASKGFTLVRLALLWERLQPMLNGDLDPGYKAYVDACIGYAKQNGMKVVLELHNYGRYRVGSTNYRIGDGTLTVAHFANVWAKIAAAYKSESGVFMYDLMNEPYDMPIPMSALTYKPDTSIIQLMQNPSVELNSDGFNFDSSDFTRSNTKAYHGTYSIKQASTSGYGSMTTPQGIKVQPNTDYTYSFYYQVQTAGNFDYETPNVQINTGDSFGNGGTTLASAQLNAISTVFLRKEIHFNSGNNTTIYIRHFNNNALVTCYYDAFNLTPGSTVKPFTLAVGNGTVATVTEMNQAAINAIRSVDLNHWIALEFDRYSGLQSFPLMFGTSTPSKWWTDPINKTMISFHYYFDVDQSGKYNNGNEVWDVAYRNRIAGQVAPALEWGKNNGVPIYIGEYGVPNDASSDSANFRQDMDIFLDILDDYEVYGTHWAGGQWYGSLTTLQPAGAFYGNTDFSADRAQMAVLTQHLGKQLVSDFDADLYYVKDEVDAFLAAKAATNHTHSISNVTGLQSALDGKAPTSHTHTADQITETTGLKVMTAAERTKLSGVATGATANDTDANLKNRANHTGTQSADTITDGTTNKAYTATEKTKLSGIETGAQATSVTNVGTATTAATAKTTPVDADTLPLNDSAASNALKKVTWANIKATLKTYFDSLYAAVTHTHTKSQITDFAHSHTKSDISDFAHTHAASDIASGVIAPARLGTGTADATTVLYGDGTFKTAPSGGSGGSGTVTNVSSANSDLTVATGTTTPVLTVVSAPKLTTARTINGVSFDGTANITITDSTKMANPMTTAGDIIYGGTSGAPTRLASSGTANRVLIVTAVGGNPAWGQVPLASAVSGTLPYANGGTNATTQAAAINNTNPHTTLGDISFRDSTNVSRLAGNITVTKMFLSQTGTGSVSAAPVWSAVAKADVGLGNVDNTADTAKPVSTAQQTALDLKQNASVVAANGMGVVVHGATASTARPTGFARITWIGTVAPTNATTNDLWFNG